MKKSESARLDVEIPAGAKTFTLVATDEPTDLYAWQKKLFVAIARNAASPIEAFDLPSDRTVSMGSSIEL